MEAEWHGASDFAEAAEALGVNTVDVMALLPDRIVLFTPSPDDDDPMIYRASLGRDADGILRAGPREEVTLTSSFQRGLEELIDARIEKAMGDE